MRLLSWLRRSLAQPMVQSRSGPSWNSSSGRFMDPTQQAVADAFFQEADRILASLISTVRDFELAEDALQDALLVALERWPQEGIPRNPAAWMTTTARRKAIDRLRRE